MWYVVQSGRFTAELRKIQGSLEADDWLCVSPPPSPACEGEQSKGGGGEEEEGR